MGAELKLYEKVYQELFHKINTKVYKPGDKIPTEYELMALYSISRTTAIRAIKELEKNKLVERSRKNGTFVSQHKIKNPNLQYVIPLVLPYDDNFNSDILDGAHEYAMSRNCFISFFNSCNSNKKEREILQKILSMDVHGLILYPCSLFSNLDIISQFCVRGIPIAFIDRKLPGIKGTLITSDSRHGEFLLVDSLIKAGHKKIAYHMIHNNMILTETERFEGYCDALIANKLSVDGNLIMRFNEDIRHKFSHVPPQGKIDIMKEYVQRTVEAYLALEDKPTAICCVNDETALLLVSAFRKAGVQVPETLSVAGFDNIKSAREGECPLTTVEQNFMKLGEYAVKSLLDTINYEEQNNYTVDALPVRGMTARPLVVQSSEDSAV